jgi:hypothetical protein
MNVTSRDTDTGGAGKHLVILVHGINTNAQWFPIIKQSLQEAGFVAAPAGYGIYGVSRFLIPVEWLRRAAIKRVYEKIRLARLYYKPNAISIIAHSFGTYVVSRIIAENFDIELNRVIFCGSVVESDFPFQNNLHRFVAPLYNEIGTRDYWPLIAAAVTWGYGSVGSDGFQNPVVNDRWHKDFHHSDFLTKAFCEKFYIPALRGEEPSPGDDAAPFPLWAQLRARLPVRWLLAACLLAAIVSGSAYVVRTAPPPATLVAAVVDLFRKKPPPPPPPAPPPPQWHQLPAGTKFTPVDGPVMTFSDIDGPSLGWQLDSGQVFPPTADGPQWETATVSGVEWLRIPTPNGRFAYIQKTQLKRSAE